MADHASRPANRRESVHYRVLIWAATVAPVIFAVLFGYALGWLRPDLDSWGGRLVMVGFVLAGGLFFYAAAFTIFSSMKARIEHQHRELTSLHDASVDIHGELALETVLQKVVDHARLLVGARYGALSVIDETGRIGEFLTSGITPEERAAMGPPPEGHGLLGVVLHEGQHLRMRDLQADPRSAGFPASHPEMHSLLAVPVICAGPFRGNLYLTEKRDGEKFTEEDEETLVRFAAIAANSIDNAHLHRRVKELAIAEERARIAREMHDGMAQVLAYLNTKAQAVEQHLKRGRREEALVQIRECAATAREVSRDVREEIFGLRAGVGLEASLVPALKEFIGRWQDQWKIRGELRVEGPLVVTPSAELQLYRIVQEALANVRKHSRATSAVVTLAPAKGQLEVTIQDDGRGFDPERVPRGTTPRFGLATMRERVESVGGSLELQTAPNEGTTVRIVMPMAGRQAVDAAHERT